MRILIVCVNLAALHCPIKGGYYHGLLYYTVLYGHYLDYSITRTGSIYCVSFGKELITLAVSSKSILMSEIMMTLLFD